MHWWRRCIKFEIKCIDSFSGIFVKCAWPTGRTMMPEKDKTCKFPFGINNSSVIAIMKKYMF
jgi:hypothetical protein